MPRSKLLCTDVVKRLLQTYPDLRDCDVLLRARVCKELGYDPLTITYCNALQLEKDKEIPNSESIRRSRAKIQEEYPELRGKSYEKRHKHCEPQWRKELRDETDKE